MKKFLKVFLIGFAYLSFCYSTIVFAYDFGDFRSITLTKEAWAAFGDLDLEKVLAYTNKCIEIYGEEAKKMQAALVDYPEGSRDEIAAYWALNDVATCLFIQGETYRRVNMFAEAKASYQKLIDEYTYGQSWDAKGWFWKPAEAARAKIKMLETGSTIDFGDYKSETLIKKAWEALTDQDLETVVAYVDKCIEIYGRTAMEMQENLTGYPSESKERIFSYFALNDVGTCLFIKGKAYQDAGEIEEAKKVYQELIDEFFYAQAWDTQGWFWKPAEAAKDELEKMEK